MSTLIQRDQTTFVRLPAPLQSKILGGCQCPYCNAHPQLEPHWDTLATDGTSA